MVSDVYRGGRWSCSLVLSGVVDGVKMGWGKWVGGGVGWGIDGVGLSRLVAMM